MTADTHPWFVDTWADLAALGEKLRGETLLAIDTEFVRERSYVPRLELLQIAARSGLVAIVDYGSLAPAADDPVGRRLLDPTVLKVLHAGEQDLEMLALRLGEVPDPIWDTQVAAGLFGYAGRSGYASMVEALVGARPKSGESMTDWSRRPLAPEQLEYAAEDVRHLLELYDVERGRLERLGRVRWAEEENAMLVARAQSARERRADEAGGYRRVRGWQKLRPKGLAILRELAAWREAEAARRNRPVGTVIRDDLLVEIARRAPASPDALRTLRGLAPALLDRHGAALIVAVEAGKRVPRAELPEAAPSGPDLEESERALVWLVQSALQALALEKEVAPSLLTGSAEVQRVIAAKLRGEPLDGVRLLRGWRGEVVGEELDRLLRGECAVSWDPAKRRLRLVAQQERQSRP